MRSPRLSLVLVAALLEGSQGVAAPVTHTISKSEVRSAPPSVTHARLKDVIWDLFEQRDYRTQKPPSRPLGRLVLETKIQGTHVPGLCRYDSVEVEFEPVRSERGPTVPSRAVGLQSTSHFHFQAPPEKEYDNLAQPRLVSAGQCAHASKDQAFFTATSESDATDAYRIWLHLLDAARKHSKLALECHSTPAEKTVPCDQIVASLKPDDLADVQDCDAPSNEVLCHKLYAGDRLITILTRAYTYPGPSPGEIVSAKVDTLIVLADRIAD